MNETSGRNSQMLLDGPSGDELDRRIDARDLRQFRIGWTQCSQTVTD